MIRFLIAARQAGQRRRIPFAWSAGTTASSGLKASSYFLAGGDAEDLIQEGLVGLYKAIRDYRIRFGSRAFRNFAELCITRQIITAVKTATRNKHTPLNQYVLVLQHARQAIRGEKRLDGSTRCCRGRRSTIRSIR